MFTQFKRLSWKTSLLTIVVSLLAYTVVLAAPGDLDTTFDGDGLVISYAVPSNVGRSDAVAGIALQANGKIVAAGFSNILSTTISDFAVIRYNTNGSLDTTFSGDGRLITNFGGVDDAQDVGVQSDGKIVAAGRVCLNNECNLALARYSSGGALDPTFSGDGKQITDFGGGNNGSMGGLEIQSNGKIVVAGYMYNGADYDFAVYRYLSNGSLDTTFSGDGIAKFGFGAGRQDFARDLIVQSDGKIVVIGYTGDANFLNNNFAIGRLTSSGSLDLAFSGDGRQIANFGADDYAAAVTLQADGKIVVVGEKDTATRYYFAVARYNLDGTPDTTFNATGRKVFSVIPNTYSWATDVLIQQDGRIVVMGSSTNGSAAIDFALVRLDTGGTFDMTFSGDGKVTVDFGGDDFGSSLALQAVDGKYILGGNTFDGAQSDFALARMLP